MFGVKLPKKRASRTCARATRASSPLGGIAGIGPPLCTFTSSNAVSGTIGAACTLPHVYNWHCYGSVARTVQPYG